MASLEERAGLDGSLRVEPASKLEGKFDFDNAFEDDLIFVQELLYKL